MPPAIMPTMQPATIEIYTALPAMDGIQDAGPGRNLREGRGHHAGKPDHGPGGEVNSRGDDDSGYAEGDQADHGNLAHDVDQVDPGQERRGHQGSNDEHSKEDEKDAVFAEEVAQEFLARLSFRLLGFAGFCVLFHFFPFIPSYRWPGSCLWPCAGFSPAWLRPG